MTPETQRNLAMAIAVLGGITMGGAAATGSSLIFPASIVTFIGIIVAFHADMRTPLPDEEPPS